MIDWKNNATIWIQGVIGCIERSNFWSSIRIETGNYLRSDRETGVIWDEECDIEPSSQTARLVHSGSTNMWDAARSGLMVSRGIGESTVSGMKEGVVAVVFPVGRAAVP